LHVAKQANKVLNDRQPFWRGLSELLVHGLQQGWGNLCGEMWQLGL
jgi:hypothetical protein